MFSFPPLPRIVPQRSLQPCPTLTLFPLQTQRLIHIHSSALIYILPQQSQPQRCLSSFSPSTFKPYQETLLTGFCGSSAYWHLQACTPRHEQKKATRTQPTETHIRASNSVNSSLRFLPLLLCQTKRDLHANQVGHLLCADLSQHLINAR